MTGGDAIEAVLRRDRLVVGAALLLLTLAAWAYVVALAGAMAAMQGGGWGMAFMPLMPMGPWDASRFALTLAMWAAMMVGMMTPSAAPMVLLHARVVRRERGGALPFAPTGAFLAGYLAVWTFFSLAATLLQAGLTGLAPMSPLMVATGPYLGGALLVAAGLYQLTPAKRACLAHCRAPIGYLAHHWRPGAWGAFRMGLTHGAYCLGCCWLLMGLLFVVGVMNLFWVAAIAAFVLLEKIVPRGEAVARASGIGLLAFAAYLALGA